MEITVLDAVRPPAKPVLAIHAGSVRRQAKLEVNKPFVIPHPGSTSCSVQVSLFQQLASQTLPVDAEPESVCSVPVKRPDGTATQVQLRLRRHAQGQPATQVDAKSQQDDVGVTRDYLEHHQLQNRIQTMIQEVLREQPPDPYKYMLDLLKKSRTEPVSRPVEAPAEAGTSTKEPEAVNAEKPLEPRPPENPKPTNARPGSKKTAGANPKVVVKRDEAHQIAYRTIRLVLRTPKCLKVAVDSLKESECHIKAHSLAASIMSNAKEKAVVRATCGSSVRDQARASITMCMQNAFVTTSRVYAQSLGVKVRAACYTGACKIITANPEWETSESLLSAEEQKNLPSDHVMLDGGGSNWSSWASSPSKSPGRRLSTKGLSKPN